MKEVLMSGAQLKPGDIFAGRYVVQRSLGEGDRKHTYLARDTKMGRDVALSLVKREAVRLDPEGTEREVKLLGSIGSHDDIVSVYDYGTDTDSGVQYIVFEYLSGGTLAEYLKKEGPLSPDALLRLGRQLCYGLAHLHKKGIIHRDVSPDNVWLDGRCEAHLGDFDSAIVAADAGELRPLTTNAFASPEERAGRSLDVRSDLFSLGGVLYVAATGIGRPADDPMRLHTQRPDLPPEFVDLVADLLSEQPDDPRTGAGSPRCSGPTSCRTAR